VSKIKKVGGLSGDQQLDTLLQHASWLRGLSEQFISALPLECLGHCQLANIRDGLLVVLVDSPAWATRVRLLGPSLLRDLRCHSAFQACQRIEVKVDYAPSVAVDAMVSSRPSSIAARSAIAEMKALLRGDGKS